MNQIKDEIDTVLRKLISDGTEQLAIDIATETFNPAPTEEEFNYALDVLNLLVMLEFEGQDDRSVQGKEMLYTSWNTLIDEFGITISDNADYIYDESFKIMGETIEDLRNDNT
jgi:hypothetical protein